MTNHRATTRAKWLELYRAFEGSGLTIREFCAERGLNYYTFKGWQAEFRRESEAACIEPGGFIEVRREPLSASSYRITLRSGRELQIEGGFVESRLVKLIEILERC